jgi:glycosyltransferase involved in cell wall biosynthesis
MRPSCLFCATKHLSQALILLSESLQGYPTHRWLAYGHMAEASDELIQDLPELAEKIRTERKRLEQSSIEKGRTSLLMDLVEELGKLLDDPVGQVLGADTQSEDRTQRVQRDMQHVQHISLDMQPGEALVRRGDGTWAPLTPSAVPPIDPRHTPEVKNIIRDFFMIEDGKGRRMIPVNPTGSTDAKAGCTSCAEKARQIREAQEAVRAAQVAGENLHAVLSEEDAKTAIQLLDQAPPPPMQVGAPEHLGRPIERGPVIILTTLADFSPSYSLSTCIKDQALALANRGYAVTLYMQEGARVNADDLPGVTVMTSFPSISWKEDTIEDSAVQRVVTFLSALSLPVNATIITHDLMFQSWFVSAAKAIHAFIDRYNQPHGARWYHVAHSSVGVRPQAANDRASAIYWRTNLPAGHTPVCLSEFDLDWFDRWYNLPAGTSQLIKNVRDPRTAWGCRPAMVTFISKHELATADVVCLFPLSLPRWRDKGLTKALDCFAKVSKACRALQGLDTERSIHRFIIAAAHANDPDQRAEMDLEIDRVIAEAGLLPHQVVRTYNDFPELRGPGLGQADMDVLWRLSNLFIFPTISEAGSLVLLEAIAANCVLILNESVPALKSYAPRSAFWLSWGSQKIPAVPPGLAGYRVIEAASEELLNRPRPVWTWETLADDWDALLSR